MAGRLKVFHRSLCFALQGIGWSLRSEPHLRIHCGAALAVILLALGMGFDCLRMAVLLGAMALVITAELINTAIEKTVDLVVKEYHPLAEIVKNVAAGAVLVSALSAVGCGLFLFGPPLWDWIAK